MRRLRYETVGGKTVLITEDERSDEKLWADCLAWIALRLQTFEIAYAHDPKKLIMLAQNWLETVNTLPELKELTRRHENGLTILLKPAPDCLALVIAWPIEQALVIKINDLC